MLCKASLPAITTLGCVPVALITELCKYILLTNYHQSDTMCDIKAS